MALKVIVSSSDRSSIDKQVSLHRSLPQTEYVVGLRKFFDINGPNGRHPCLVLEVAGPNLESLLLRRPEFRLGEAWERRFTKSFSGNALRDILMGLDVLHSRSIVHGDLHFGNIVAAIERINANATSEERLRQSSTQGNPLRRLDGKKDLWAPSYLIEPAPLYQEVSLSSHPLVKITDLGSGRLCSYLFDGYVHRFPCAHTAMLAFLENNPPEKTVTPVALRAPETVLGLPIGRGIDIWCVGCLIFEFLTGHPLFVGLESLEGNAYDEQTNDEHLIQLSEVLGPLPSEIFSKWRRGDKYFGPDGTRLAGDDELDRGQADEDFDENHETKSASKGFDDAIADDDASDLDEFSSDGSVPLAAPGRFGSLETQFHLKKLDGVDKDEEQEIMKLLRWIFEYESSNRPSAREILGHPWLASYS